MASSNRIVYDVFLGLADGVTDPAVNVEGNAIQRELWLSEAEAREAGTAIRNCSPQVLTSFLFHPIRRRFAGTPTKGLGDLMRILTRLDPECTKVQRVPPGIALPFSATAPSFMRRTG